MSACLFLDGPPTVGQTLTDGTVALTVTKVDWKLDGSAVYGFSIEQTAGPTVTVTVHGGGRSFTFHRHTDLDTFADQEAGHFPLEGAVFCYSQDSPTTTTGSTTTTSIPDDPAPTTTTTAAATTTTTVPAAATTVAPTTTLPPPTTTIPAATTVASTAAPPSTLPVTGAPTDVIAGVGLAAVVAGGALVAAARRWLA